MISLSFLSIDASVLFIYIFFISSFSSLSNFKIVVLRSLSIRSPTWSF